MLSTVVIAISIGMDGDFRLEQSGKMRYKDRHQRFACGRRGGSSPGGLFVWIVDFRAHQVALRHAAGGSRSSDVERTLRDMRVRAHSSTSKRQ